MSGSKDDFIAAAERGDIDALRLVSKQAGLRHDSRRAQAALVAAAENGKQAVVVWLLDWGVSVESVDDDKRRAMSVACVTGRTEIVQELVKRGADVKTADHEGKKPLDLALGGAHLAVCKVLLKAGVVPNSGQTCKGFASVVAAVQQEALIDELKNFAADAPDIGTECQEADEAVWKAQREHMRLMGMREEQRSAHIVIDLEKQIETENEVFNDKQKGEMAVQQELSDLRVNLQTVETACSLLKQQLEQAESLTQEAVREEAVADVMYREMLSQLGLAQSEQETSDKSNADKESSRDADQDLMKRLVEEAKEMQQENNEITDRLKAESAELRGWERDREAAAALTAETHAILRTAPQSPVKG